MSFSPALTASPSMCSLGKDESAQISSFPRQKKGRAGQRVPFCHFSPCCIWEEDQLYFRYARRGEGDDGGELRQGGFREILRLLFKCPIPKTRFNLEIVWYIHFGVWTMVCDVNIPSTGTFHG